MNKHSDKVTILTVYQISVDDLIVLISKTYGLSEIAARWICSNYEQYYKEVKPVESKVTIRSHIVDILDDLCFKGYLLSGNYLITEE